ncbi:hypothetical protein NEMBOFW57_003926 [Staphylotrichum longicolle]|uniref:Uncharacterized protein n=1 Tax=Staphylotrichum longicolle TaxID=669026 RepID=A0AAD4I3R0_9PEZI|nr:hypothetical protein NEMBOFW57_003926 [Staphylotrichum longicolle]
MPPMLFRRNGWCAQSEADESVPQQWNSRELCLRVALHSFFAVFLLVQKREEPEDFVVGQVWLVNGAPAIVKVTAAPRRRHFALTALSYKTCLVVPLTSTASRVVRKGKS